MANSMMDSVLALVTPEMKQAIASRLGESPQAVQGGLGVATAATLGGLAAKAGDSSFLSQVMNLASAANSQNVLGGLSTLAAGGAAGGLSDLINKFLPMIFGSQQAAVASAIGQQSGLGADSVSGLLKMAAPLVLGFLGRAQSTGSLNVGSLGNMLRSELPGLQAHLPVHSLTAGAGQAATALTTGGAAAPGGSRWLVPLAILGALILAWLLYRSLSTPKEVVQTAATGSGTAATAGGNAANSAWAALGEMIKVKLPDGTELNAPALGVEAKLVKYLDDPSSAVTDDTWFDFDRLLFDTGAATLQPASQEQLNNIAAILRAYPKAKVRIGGYTDNTGDGADNLKLSQARADDVMAELAKLGVDPARMEAKGYGEEHPLADNSTEEGRQKNRRISLHITEK